MFGNSSCETASVRVCEKERILIKLKVNEGMGV